VTPPANRRGAGHLSDRIAAFGGRQIAARGDRLEYGPPLAVAGVIFFSSAFFGGAVAFANGRWRTVVRAPGRPKQGATAANLQQARLWLTKWATPIAW